MLLTNKKEGEGSILDFDSLIDMDILVYSHQNNNNDNDNPEESKCYPYYFLGAMQEDGTLAPLSTWTLDPAFDNAVEFVVDECDRFSLQNVKNTVQVHYLVQQSELSYGSRQCHRGVSNPHGEESELLYYVDKSVIDKYQVTVNVKPELEILW